VFRRRRRGDADQADRASGTEQEFDEQDEEFDDEELEDSELADEYEDSEAGDEESDGPEVQAPAAEDVPAEDLGDPATWTRLRDSSASAAAQQESGPWDAASGFPDGDRMDFGSLLVPVREGFDIQVNLDEEAGIWIAVVYGDSALQLQAFAAPKRSGIWEDVRLEIQGEVAKAGGTSAEADGPFGPELHAQLVQAPAPDAPPASQTLRFLGVDGPRWFLRGLITGPATVQPPLAAPFEEIFGDVVVVRGDHAEPPRKALDIALPEEARQVIEQQMEAEGMPNPFERGPEITEIH
jgi:hypothetical protein